MLSQRLSSEERFLIARRILPDRKGFALSLAYAEEEERLARSGGNLGATVVLLGARGMNCGPWRTATMRIRIRRIKKQFAVRSSQFGDGPGSGRNRLARRLRIGLSNSCQEAIARSKSQPFQVSIQGQLVMLGFILGLGQDRRLGGQLFKHLRYSRQEEKKQFSKGLARFNP